MHEVTHITKNYGACEVKYKVTKVTAKPGVEINMFKACYEVEQQVRAWMRSGARLLPKEVTSNAHMEEVWYNTIERLENEVRI